MRKLLFYLLLASFSSRSFAQEDLKWINQVRFDKKPEVKYIQSKDEFTNVADELSSVIAKESLYNLSAMKLEEVFSKTSEVLVKISTKCYQLKFEEALKIADEIYWQYKNNPSYWNQMGTCFYLNSDYSKAILYYNKARDLDGKFAPAVNNLGVVYTKQAKYQKALSAFKKALDLNSFGITPNYNMARLYLRFGVSSKALPILQALQKRSPKDNDVNSALASTYLIAGDAASALGIYSSMDKVLLQRPWNALNYAVALKEMNKVSEAQSALSNVSGIERADLKTYLQKVEKFVRN
jgi:tetratricopeptide (TPR) repeat protein